VANPGELFAVQDALVPEPVAGAGPPELIGEHREQRLADVVAAEMISSLLRSLLFQHASKRLETVNVSEPAEQIVEGSEVVRGGIPVPPVRAAVPACRPCGRLGRDPLHEGNRCLARAQRLGPGRAALALRSCPDQIYSRA
jgi:hypothetical protein